ncbi:L-2-hydroxyglutarate oxidase [Calycomorphotria hydatis]|uniref:L-2-hydroxyglutarate oxidase LhgO n=1 Tax=Calycomorphotria hydatis TaxID=2528027 RepID=A0A517T445_9PLAN|nr:L-2-hydroxyglutarate oxidase [Calycomorphotria hydatis]QDT63148.1 L-2-hydroxyglutarate oxidase LhgO [Calycomorphotria hydatis]
MRTDVAIIGGGIVGLATAYQLTRRDPPPSVIVLEKENAIAQHQTGHNSGVIHSGIYYRPNSLKAINCREGKRQLEEFCEQEGIPFDRCGKVIVATTDEEVPRLEALQDRGEANGVMCERISVERLHELEPHVNGVAALYVPETGIIDFTKVCERLTERVLERNGTLMLKAEVKAIRQSSGHGPISIESTNGDVEADRVITCAGLQSDRVARLAGLHPAVKVVPFRGEYFRLKPDAQHLVRNLIYPVPDPQFPFLGVHFTRMIEGGIECGPNAVLAFAREGYTKFDADLGDLAETLTFGGFLKMASKHWKMGLGEMWRSLSKSAFVTALQKLVPEIQAEHLEQIPAGVRAQAVRSNGDLVDDFLIEEEAGMIHVLNAPSPAATSALNIGRTIAAKIPQA